TTVQQHHHSDGKNFHLAQWESRLKCPRCGSRRIRCRVWRIERPRHQDGENRKRIETAKSLICGRSSVVERQLPKRAASAAPTPADSLRGLKNGDILLEEIVGEIGKWHALLGGQGRKIRLDLRLKVNWQVK